MSVPIFVYRGDLKSLAALAGMRNARIPVQKILFSGKKSVEGMAHLNTVNQWLEKNSLPKIDPFQVQALPPHFTLLDPVNDWGWNEAECMAAIRLSGLPLPQAT